LHARESAMSVGMSINWVANWAVAYCFPALLAAAREWAFMVFIGTTAVFFVFTWRFVPETKNRSVPEISAVFERMPMPYVGAR
jgi:membrane protein implicated in regulation of membrane protease activity